MAEILKPKAHGGQKMKKVFHAKHVTRVARAARAKKVVVFASLSLFCLLSYVYSAGAAGIVTGELKKWHTVTVTFDLK